MRLFERDEIIKHKCPVCGCRNKLYTVVRNCCGERIGYNIRCCNCGSNLYRSYLGDYDNLITPEVEKAMCGDNYCIRLHLCARRKTCPYYKFNLLDLLRKFRRDRKFKKAFPDFGTNTCTCSMPHNTCNKCSNKKSNCEQLNYKAEKNAKFR